MYILNRTSFQGTGRHFWFWVIAEIKKCEFFTKNRQTTQNTEILRTGRKEPHNLATVISHHDDDRGK